MSFLFRLINIIHVQTLTQVRCSVAPQWEREIGDRFPHPRAQLLISPTFTLEAYLDPSVGSWETLPAILTTFS